MSGPHRIDQHGLSPTRPNERKQIAPTDADTFSVNERMKIDLIALHSDISITAVMMMLTSLIRASGVRRPARRRGDQHPLSRCEAQPAIGSNPGVQRLQIEARSAWVANRKSRSFLSLSSRFFVNVPAIAPRSSFPSSTVLCAG